MNQIFESNTRLYGARLWIVRALWLIFVGSILIMFCIVAYENLFEPLSVCETNACAMTPAEYARWQATGIRPEFANFTTGIVFGLVMPLVFFLVAVIIAWRRSDDWMGLLVSFALVGLGPYLLTGVNLTMSARPGWNILTNVLQSATVFTFGSLFYLFPDGRVVPRGARRLLWVIFILLCASGIVDATHVLNRFGAHAQEQSDALGILIFFVVFLRACD
jgi:hypothetical protein